MRSSHTTTNSSVKSAVMIEFPASAAQLPVKDSSTNLFLLIQDPVSDGGHEILSCYCIYTLAKKTCTLQLSSGVLTCIMILVAGLPATATSVAGGIVVLLELGRRASWSCDETPLVIGIDRR